MTPRNRTNGRWMTHPLWIAVSVFIVASAVVTALTVLWYRTAGVPAEFWDRLLVEAYGVLMDILILGGLVLWLNQKGRVRLEIQRYHDEIEDFRDWRFQEAAYRISGNIRRLNRNKVSQMDLSRCLLKNMQLSAVDLGGATLLRTDLQGAYLAKANFRSADLNGANLGQAFCYKADFTAAILVGADLTGARMENAVFRGAYFQQAALDGADLTGADLTGAKGLLTDQLAAVKTLYKATMDPELADSIRQHHPGLFDPPAPV